MSSAPKRQSLLSSTTVNDAPRYVPQTHHLDGHRATSLLAVNPDDDGDDLLTTMEVAIWLGCSPQFLTIGRSKGYGPKFVNVFTRRIAYKRNDVREWLKSRTFSSTKESREGLV